MTTVTIEEIHKITKSLNPMIEEFTTQMSKKIALQMDSERNLKKIEYLEGLLGQIVSRCIDAKWEMGWGSGKLNKFACELLQLACYNTDEYRNMK